MTQTVGWGIVATGLIANMFVSDLRVAGLTVAAVSSRTLARAEEFAAEYEIPNAYGSVEELLADPSVDIVYIATPHPLHAKDALAALHAGKHVLVEKAFTLNAPEARAVVELGAAKGLLVLEAMWTRFLPHMIEIRQLIADGLIGDAQLLIADHTQSLPTEPDHRINAPELGGGALLDLGIYPVSFAVDLFGIPESQHVEATFTSTGVDQRMSGVLVHAGGRHTIFSIASNMAGPNRATIIGSRGRIEIDPVWYSGTGYTVYDSEGAVLATSRPEFDGRAMQFEALEAERLIRAGQTESPLMPTAQTVAIMDLMDAMRASIGLVYPGERGDHSAE